jgi:hypothetical protein
MTYELVPDTVVWPENVPVAPYEKTQRPRGKVALSAN